MARTFLDPKIELQELLHKQIYTALQGDMLQQIRKICVGTDQDTHIRSSFEGNSLKVEKDILPDVYDMCQEVLKKLKFTEPVDFYISGHSEVNAFTISSDVEGKPHIVNIQSALFKLMNKEELKFVIGHEIGHLINRDCQLRALEAYVYPKMYEDDYAYDDMIDYLSNRIILHDQIAELGADRWGYMACENLDACIRAFYKLGSGLDLSDMNISMSALIAKNKKRLDFFLNEGGVSEDDHPVNAIRIQALYLFATAKTQKELRQGMKELTDILWNLNPMEFHLAFFYATAGLIVASADGKIVPEEKQKIIESLGEYEFCPNSILAKIEKSDVNELFEKSVSELATNVPGIRPQLLNYFIEVACSDNQLAPEEIDLIFAFGEKLEFSPSQIAQEITKRVRTNYVPKVL